MLKNDYLAAKIGVDTAENELFQAEEGGRMDEAGLASGGGDLARPG